MRLVKPMAESSWSPEGTGSAHVAPIFIAWSNNFPVEQQLLLRRELGSVGSTRGCSSAEEARLEFVESKGCSVWNFFKWWFSKRGTNKVKKPPHSLPALLQRPFLGRAGPRPHLQQKNWPEPGTFDCTSVVDPPQCPGSPQAEKSCRILSRDTAQAGKGRVQLGVPVPWGHGLS